MGEIVGTAPSIISGSVGLYNYRQTKDGTIVSEKIKAKGVGMFRTNTGDHLHLAAK